MVHSIEGHFPIQEEQKERLTCLMEKLLGPINDLNRCLGRLSSSEAVLRVSKQWLHKIGYTSVKHFSEKLIQGVQKGDRPVITRKGVVPFFKDASDVCLFPRLRNPAIRPASINQFKNVRAIKIVKV